MIFTVGHSTRSADDFLALLRGFAILRLADVRTVPRSRHNPQFNRETLSETLPQAGIAYRHFPELGGFRRAQPDSINTGWRNASFRGFADHMQTAEFAAGLADFLAFAADVHTVILCAEAVPWRCHRSLIADALVARGVPVEDILAARDSRPHKLTPFLRIEGSRLTYPGADSQPPLPLP